MLVQSYLNFCQMTRRCGNSNDLLVALSKTGFLELKYETSDDIASIYPAILTERAEVLWKRQERAEAVETLRSLVKISNQLDFKFTLISKEMILARMVESFAELVFSNQSRVPGRRKCDSFRQMKLSKKSLSQPPDTCSSGL